MRIVAVVVVGIVALCASTAQATMFNVGLVSSTGQFLNGQPETYGRTASSTLAYPCDDGVPDGTIFIVVPDLFVNVTATALDDFTSYAVKPSKGASKLAPFGPLTLSDEFGSADYDVTKLLALDAPADVNGADTFDDTTHLARYALKRRKTSPKFQKIVDLPITTECGDLAVTLAKPESLLVPVDKSLTSPPPAVPDPATSLVDHFLCYAAKAQKKRTDGTVAATLPKKMQIGTSDPSSRRRCAARTGARACLRGSALRADP